MEVHTFDTLYQCKKLGARFYPAFFITVVDYEDYCLLTVIGCFTFM